MKLLHSDLPIFWEEETKKLRFETGLLCDGFSEKKQTDMKGLWRSPENLHWEETVYQAYRNIRRPEDEKVFQRYDIRYDITVIRPGKVNGECNKTSGHYHGCVPGSIFPYPEVYEVLKGEVMFIMQKADFTQPGEPEITDLAAVRVGEGQAVIIPPFYGHCSVNPLGETVMFSNLAVVSCPIHYGPIQEKRGLAVYLLKEEAGIRLQKNDNYIRTPEVRVTEGKEEKRMGIEFGKSCYRNFVENPEKYDFLLHPDKYIETMEQML